MAEAELANPAKPPCPWCSAPIGIRDVNRWQGQSYCPRCHHCVEKYLQFGDASGLLVTGWYWGKHRAHVPGNQTEEGAV